MSTTIKQIKLPNITTPYDIGAEWNNIENKPNVAINSNAATTTGSVAFYSSGNGSLADSTNLIWNNTNRILNVGGSITATGDLNLNGNAYLNNESYIDSATINSLIVNGNTNFVQTPIAPTAPNNSNDNTLATTAFVMNAFTTNDANKYIVAGQVSTSAIGSYATAEGTATNASGTASHAEGQNTVASGMNSHAEGEMTTASQHTAHSEGYFTAASGTASHTEGDGTQAIGHGAHAEGNTTNASGTASHAEGYNTKASGTASHAEGYNTTASGFYSHAEGDGTIASGFRAHAEGFQTNAFELASHAEGAQTNASGTASHAEGNTTIASGMNSHAEGRNTTASGFYSHAEGYSTTASGTASHAEGYQTVASGEGAHAEGKTTTASTTASHAEGLNTVSSGTASHAEGCETTASGGYSHAEGWKTIASGLYSHAEGMRTTASGFGSHAEGSWTQATNYQSHAEGMYTVATQDGAHAEGYYTYATKQAAHAEGSYTTASGSKAHAEGYYTNASGDISHAEGHYTIANHNSQHVFGRYNIADPSTAASTTIGTYIEIVGNGTGSNTRSNARTLDWNGNEVLSGSISATTFYGLLSTSAAQAAISTGIGATAIGSIGKPIYWNGSTFSATGNNTRSVFYGTCNTVTATAAKVVDCPDFNAEDLVEGTIINVKFSYTNSASTANLALDVNGTGSKAIKYYNNASLVGVPSAGHLVTGRTYMFHYDGTYWILDNLNYYSDSTTRVLAVYRQTTANYNADYPLLIARTLPTSITSTAGKASNVYGVIGPATAVPTVNPYTGLMKVPGNINSYIVAGQVADAAIGLYATAEGTATCASGTASHAEGSGTTASGGYSHAEGQSTFAFGNYSHAEGKTTTASGNNSHAEGWNTMVSGSAAHTEGYNTTASGNYSHAEGYYTKASGQYSHAEGQYTIAASAGQHVLGKYNISDASSAYIEIVGNGTKESARSNARTLDWSGNERLAGTLTTNAPANDYAEMRNISNTSIQPGRCITEIGDGSMVLTTDRLQRGCKIVSDTYGINIGESEGYDTPIAVAGRALVYLYEDRTCATYCIGYPVCSGPNGTVSIMTEEEEMRYPSRIVGTISEVPNYKVWGNKNILVDNRIWIYVK